MNKKQIPDIVDSILKSYKVSWTSQGVDWDYKIEEKIIPSAGGRIEIWAGANNAYPLCIFREQYIVGEDKTDSDAYYDAWYSILLMLGRIGVNVAYQQIVQRKRDEYKEREPVERLYPITPKDIYESKK
jgi:hypothetical protein